MLITISIPEEGTCLLKSGQKVDFDSFFLEKKIPSDSIIPISAKLKVKPDKIFRYLKKFVGDKIERNEIIAEKKSLFSTETIISENTGIIKEINHSEGNLLVTNLQQSTQIKAFFKGEVNSITKNEMKLKVDSAEEFALKTVNADFGGFALYIKDKDKSISAQDSLNPIMIIESFTNYLQAKAEALGIKGFVYLKKLDTEISSPNAQVKNNEDLKKIFRLNYPYCLINNNYSKIYFYR